MRGFAYGAEQLRPTAPAEWWTRQAETQDIYGMERPQGMERLSTEDATLVGGFLSEEVCDVLRTGYGRPEVVTACREIGQPWAWEAPSFPTE